MKLGLEIDTPKSYNPMVDKIEYYPEYRDYLHISSMDTFPVNFKVVQEVSSIPLNYEYSSNCEIVFSDDEEKYLVFNSYKIYIYQTKTDSLLKTIDVESSSENYDEFDEEYL